MTSVMDQCKTDKRYQAALVGMMCVLTIGGSMIALAEQDDIKTRVYGVALILDAIVLPAVSLAFYKLVKKNVDPEWRLLKIMGLVGIAAFIGFFVTGESGFLGHFLDNVKPVYTILGILAAVNVVGCLIFVMAKCFIWAGGND